MALVNLRRHVSKQPENGAFGTARVTDWTKQQSKPHSLAGITRQKLLCYGLPV